VIRLSKSVVVSLLATCMTLASCAPKIDSDAYLQHEAGDIQLRTLPPGSRLVNQRPLTLQGLGASADWELECAYSPDEYRSWVTSRLRPDFQVHETHNSQLRLSKDVHGDVETLSLELVSSTGTLHVVVKLEIYPD